LGGIHPALNGSMTTPDIATTDNYGYFYTVAMNATNLLGEEVKHIVTDNLAIVAFDLFTAEFD